MLQICKDVLDKIQLGVCTKATWHPFLPPALHRRNSARHLSSSICGRLRTFPAIKCGMASEAEKRPFLFALWASCQDPNAFLSHTIHIVVCIRYLISVYAPAVLHVVLYGFKVLHNHVFLPFQTTPPNRYSSAYKVVLSSGGCTSGKIENT